MLRRVSVVVGLCACASVTTNANASAPGPDGYFQTDRRAQSCGQARLHHHSRDEDTARGPHGPGLPTLTQRSTRPSLVSHHATEAFPSSPKSTWSSSAMPAFTRS